MGRWQVDKWQFDGLPGETIAWYTGRMPVAGRLLDKTPWVHLHRLRAVHFLLRAGPPDEALCRAAATTANHATSVPLREGVDLEQLYRSLASEGRTICQDDSSVPSHLFVPSHPELPSNSSYDRQGALTCRPWHFKAGDHYTVVGFFRPR